MTKEELIAKLSERSLVDQFGNQEPLDHEELHIRADNLLLKFIDDPDITTAFRAVSKWYA